MIPTQHGTVYASALPAPPLEPAPVVAALRHAAASPDRPAVTDGATGERLSRVDLAARSAVLAAGLKAHGIGRGDLVAVAMPNCAAWPVVALGVWRAGAVLVALSPFWSAEESGRLLTRVRPRLTLAPEPLLGLARDALSAAGIAPAVAAPDELRGAGDPFAEPQPDPGDTAVILFSSGTSGMNKGARVTHGSLAAIAAQLAGVYALDDESVVLAGAPFFAMMGIATSLCMPLVAGAPIVTIAIPRTRPVLGLIAEHRVTHATVPPPVIAEVAADREISPSEHLRLLATGGAHVPAAAQERAGERLGCLVRQGYGMTEAGAISGPRDRPSDPDTVGWLVAGTEARLVDPESGRDVAPGQPGELWVRGPQVMAGYHGDPDATAATITADGWLRTGDLVAIRADGQLVIRDRLKELIKVDGISVAPAELELLLREHPEVQDAAVVGRPDPVRGEVPVAYVVGTAAPAELMSFVNPRVVSHKRLHDVRIVDALPRMPSGKLLRRVLRE
jgi:acyl-CoA synthetase (AMP-forming)/AMP-acid ligase II